MSAPRRIVTGHDDSGRSIVLSDGPAPKTVDVGTAAFHEVWVTEAVPAPIPADEPEPTDRPVRTPAPAGGVVVRYTEMAPGAASPMHRTETLDVGVVLSGETCLLLDDGSETQIFLPVPATATALLQNGKQLPAKRVLGEPNVLTVDWAAAQAEAGVLA